SKGVRILSARPFEFADPIHTNLVANPTPKVWSRCYGGGVRGTGTQHRMELRHLRYFVAAAEELNFGRAAARLRVSQPPLSRQIKNLEEEIGAPLFDCSRRKLQLTPAGKSFLEQAKQILALSDRAARLAKAVGQGKCGQLTVGFLSPLGGLFLPAGVRKF